MKRVLKFAFRNFLNNKVTSEFNIIGLTISLTCIFFIFIWVDDELSFDKFNVNCNQIYRVNVKGNLNNKSIVASSWPARLGPDVKAHFPEIDDVVRIDEDLYDDFKYGDKSFYESGGLYADNSIFNIFSFNLIKGDPRSALSRPHTMVITEKIASKYFGNKEPIGEIVRFGEYDYEISGIMKNVPGNSHMKFDFLCSFATVEKNNPNRISWDSDNVITYFLIKPWVNVQAFSLKFKEYTAKEAATFTKIGLNFHLQSLRDIHFENNFDSNFGDIGDKNTVVTFILIGFLVLFLAIANFINLFIARSLKNGREIALKKTIGAKRFILGKEYVIEVLLNIFICIFLSSIIIKLSLPYFNQLASKSLAINLDFHFILFLFLLTVVLAALAGGYPAYHLTRLNPVHLFRNENFQSFHNLKTRKALVVFQFSISILLIIVTLFVIRQTIYIKEKDLGFDNENIIHMHLSKKVKDQYFLLKDELLKNPNIINVTAKSCLPTDRNDGGPLFKKGLPINEAPLTERCWIDVDYIKTMNIKIKEGRDFSKDYPTDLANSCILNETAKKMLRFETSIGEKVFFNDEERVVIGVIKDVYSKSLHQLVEPQVYLLRDKPKKNSVMLLKIRNIPEAIKHVKKVWEKYCHDVPCEYSFLDSTYDQLYKKDQNAAKFFWVFTILAIIINCLGLFNLSVFIASQKIKEIGIRKINGAKISEILVLINKDFVRSVTVAFVIATPIAYYAMSKWLEGFAYKTELSWWIFALAGLLALGIALLTVSWQSWRAATRNPVEALRYE